MHKIVGVYVLFSHVQLVIIIVVVVWCC